MDNSYLAGCKLSGMFLTVNACEAFLVGSWVRNSESPGGLLKAPQALGGRHGLKPSSDSRGGAHTLHPGTSQPVIPGDTGCTGGKLLNHCILVSVWFQSRYLVWTRDQPSMCEWCMHFLLLLELITTIQGIKTPMYYFTQTFQKSEMGLKGLKASCPQVPAPSGGSRGESIPYLFWFLEAARLCSSWLLHFSPFPSSYLL